MELVEKQRKELGRSRNAGNFQLTLKMLEELKAKAKATQDALAKAEKTKGEVKPRSKSGPTAQPDLPIVEQEFTLDDPDRACPSCGGQLHDMFRQIAASEMIDVVEVSYRVV